MHVSASGVMATLVTVPVWAPRVNLHVPDWTSHTLCMNMRRFGQGLRRISRQGSSKQDGPCSLVHRPAHAERAIVVGSHAGDRSALPHEPCPALVRLQVPHAARTGACQPR